MRVLITGGNKGIGLATTKKFIANNHEVIIIARDFSTFDLGDVKTIEFDLAKTEQLNQLVEQVGDINILINNAGIMHALPYNSYPDEKKDEILKINLKTPIKLIELFSQGMVSKGRGRIVNVSSIAGQIGHPDIWYGVTKASVINMTKSFAKILGPKGIVVNAVSPGPVNTDLLNTIPEERKQQLKQMVYLNRFAKPEEVADTIYWLATDSPEYINGVCIDINNGAFPR